MPRPFAIALLFAIAVVTGIAPVHAQSNSLKSYLELQQADLQQEIPPTLAGMQLSAIKPRLGGFTATYAGGSPAAEVAVVSRVLFTDPAKFQARVDKQVAAGKVEVLTRGDHTLYLKMPAKASEPPQLLTLLEQAKLLQVMARPESIADGAQREAVKQQLLAAFDALDLQHMAGLARTGLPISGHVTLSGSMDKSVNLNMVMPRAAQVRSKGKSANEVVWSIELLGADAAVQIGLIHLPIDLRPGQYALREVPALMSSDNPFAQPAARLVVEQRPDGDNKYWDENVSGTLVIDSVSNQRMTGSFSFVAQSDTTGFDDDVPTVTVKGQFADVPILNGQ